MTRLEWLRHVERDLAKQLLERMEKESVEAVTPFEREIAEEYNRDIMGKLSEVIEINEVPAETLAKFRETAASIYEESYADIGDEGRAVVEAIIEQTH